MEIRMKKALMAAAAFVALPVMAQAQSPSPGVYIGAEGGVNWLLNFTANTEQSGAVADGERDAADGLGGRWRDRLRLCRPAR